MTKENVVILGVIEQMWLVSAFYGSLKMILEPPNNALYGTVRSELNDIALTRMLGVKGKRL